MERLRFLQIPKTAGSTLAYILLRQYRGAPYFYFMSAKELDAERYAKLSDSERREIRLFLGHMPIKTGYFEADDATIITLLREPIARVQSFCQHVSEGKSPYIQRELNGRPFNLDEFLKGEKYEISNLQTKMLINTGSCVSSSLIDSMSRADARDLALENLFNSVSRFGIQEHFDESLIVFAQFLHWRMPYYLPSNLKDSRHLIDFEQHHLDQIVELNSIDSQVYTAARQRFLELIASPDFDSDKLKRIKLLNPFVSLYMRIQSKIYYNASSYQIILILSHRWLSSRLSSCSVRPLP